MNKMRLIARTCILGIAAAACCFAFSGCVYDVPITSKPTRQIDARLLGNWTSADGKTKLQVVKLDNYNYIVSKNEGNEVDLYRVWHSEVGKTPLVTVQILDKSKKSKPQYAYWVWQLSGDGRLHLRMVNDKIIPDDVKSSAMVRKLLKKNLQNPALFGEESQFTKDK